MLLLAFSLPTKTNADSIEYNEYNYLVNVYELNYDNDFYLFNVIASIQNNILIYVDGDNTGYAWKSDIDISQVGLYLVNASSLEPVLNFYYYLQLNQVISYQTYIANVDNFAYTTGYSNGFIDGNADGYDTGYDLGYNEGLESQSSSHYSDGYSNGYDTGYDLGYNAGINAQIPQQQFSLFSLLGVIFLFPFKLLALGFDIDIFGVNVGGLMIGCIIIFFIMAIIGIAKSKFI